MRVFAIATVLMLSLAAIPAAHAATIFTEDFSGGIPGDWSVVDNLSGGAVWRDDDPGDRATENAWAQISGGFAIADSGWWASEYTDGSADTELVSPSIDCSNFAEVQLFFFTDFRSAAPGDHAYVEVSNDETKTWNEAEHFDATDVTETSKTVDVSEWADEQANVKVRFRYVTGGTDQKWWAVDDVRLTGIDFTVEDDDADDDAGDDDDDTDGGGYYDDDADDDDDDDANDDDDAGGDDDDDSSEDDGGCCG
ncbi:MAG: immune inhibitor A [Deltaproteobacteria bacterium]|nr:immune inhibitor A [Deltaproteobacteria bacterium]